MLNYLGVLGDMLAPRGCGGCGRSGSVLCLDCSDSLMAMPLPPPLDCPAGPALAAFPYRGTIRGMLHRGKYRGGRALLRALADLAVERLPAPPPDRSLVAVPLGRRRRRRRGYNQSEVISERLAGAWDLPILSGLCRVRETPPQVGTDAEARHANVAGCFGWAGGELCSTHVILVDDVVTTGATTAAAAAALAASGALSATVIALARVL